MQNDMLKVKSKNLIFKNNITGMKTCLLVNNNSKVKFIDKFFLHTNKISTFKLEKLIKLVFGNGKMIQKLIKEIFVNIIIKDHIEQLVCYLAK